MAVSLTKEQEQELFFLQRQKEIEAEAQIRIMEKAQEVSKGGMTDLQYEEAVERIRCEVRDEFAEKQSIRDARRDNIQLAIAILGAAGGIIGAGATIWSSVHSSNAQIRAAEIGTNKKVTHTHLQAGGTIMTV